MTADEVRVASVCSGIGGAELAFAGIAQHAFAAEIEQFPRAVLAHHFPGMKLYGDFTEIPAAAGPVDVLVGGTPCQSFSVAGLRGGMADARGNLALEFLRLAERLRARWVLWENVPGVLSSSDGRDFGAFVGGLAELGYGWAYRILDAQYFGLAQRRKRVFVVGCLGDWRRAAAVLFEPSSLRGDTAPGRETREGIANALTERADRGGTNSEGQRLIAHPLRAQSQPSHRADSDTYIARCLNAHPSRIDGESETFVTQATAATLTGQMQGGSNQWAPWNEADNLITHSLRADGFDASEDGTGRGTPLVAQQLYSIMPQNSGRDYKARPVDVAQPVMAAGPGSGDQGGDVVVQAFDILGTPATRGGAETDVHTALRSRAPGQSEASTTTVIAQAFHQNQRAEVTTNDTAGALNSGGGKPGQGYPAIMQAFNISNETHTVDVVTGTMAANQGTCQANYVGNASMVRRLTPTECERLQGFPDGWTEVAYRGKPAADGPRYRALGNAFAVPVVRWIARRIVREVGYDG